MSRASIGVGVQHDGSGTTWDAHIPHQGAWDQVLVLVLLQIPASCWYRPWEAAGDGSCGWVPTHPCERSELSFGYLAMAWPRPGCCGHLESDQQIGTYSLPFKNTYYFFKRRSPFVHSLKSHQKMAPKERPNCEHLSKAELWVADFLCCLFYLVFPHKLDII